MSFISVLKKAGIDSPAFDALCIFESKLGLTRHDLIMTGSKEAAKERCDAVTELAQKRAEGYPLQYLLGMWQFMDSDFFVGEGADVTIVAGCGVHADNEGEAKHNGIHRFFVGKGAKVVYQEKHLGTGAKTAFKRIDPVTDAVLEDDSYLEMDTVQLGGVDSTLRQTRAKVGNGAKLIVRERIMTDGEEKAETDFKVEMNGEDSAVDLVSRSVAKGHSCQQFKSEIIGNNRCTGHSECDAILVDNGRVNAAPALEAAHLDAALIHEAAIGKIAGEQIIKLCTLGLTEEEAQERIISGFLK